jgi:hypothetical protein
MHRVREAVTVSRVSLLFQEVRYDAESLVVSSYTLHGAAKRKPLYRTEHDLQRSKATFLL